MDKSTVRVQIFAAASNAAFADRLTLALHAAGFDIVNGAFDPGGADAVVIVWSGSSINANKLIEAARAPLAAGALAPVSIGRIEPPEEFRHLPPIDLAGWTGDAADRRWRLVVEVIEQIAAARRAPSGENIPAEVPAAPAEDVGALLTEWPPKRRDRDAPAFTPLLAARNRFRVPASLVFGFTLIAAMILGGFISLVSKVSKQEDEPTEVAGAPEAAPDAAPPLLAVVEPAAKPAAAPAASPDEPANATNAAEDEIASLISENTADAAAAPQSKPDAGRLFKDCAICPEMATIPAGAFAMGAPEGERQRQASERPVVEVTIARPFALSTHEVTFAEWDACVAAEGCPTLADSGWGRGAQPAINVSWEDANAYAAWLSKTTGAPYRLPTEAEWEYAARAGAATPFAFGEGISAHQANFDGSLPYRAAPAPARRRPLPVGKFAPNAFGLYDMHGNVWEWVADCWAVSHQGQAADGAARSGACSTHVLKGGAWNTGGWRLRVAHRIAKNAKAREYDNGFRVARDLP
jgi:formylglycine-generating enzyme required for sulfatase activity